VPGRAATAGHGAQVALRIGVSNGASAEIGRYATGNCQDALEVAATVPSWCVPPLASAAVPRPSVPVAATAAPMMSLRDRCMMCSPV
jgi:hypothetical protein